MSKDVLAAIYNYLNVPILQYPVFLNIHSNSRFFSKFFLSISLSRPFSQQRTEISPMRIIRLKVSGQEQLSGLLQFLSRVHLSKEERKKKMSRRKRHDRVACSLLPVPLMILTDTHTRARARVLRASYRDASLIKQP